MLIVMGVVWMIFRLFCILQVFLTLSVLVDASFHPIDSFLIDCGGNTTTIETKNGRQFKPDLGYPSVSLYTISDSVVYSGALNDLLDPFRSARVFDKPSTYSIGVKTGLHWLRLHFYPIQDQHYNLRNATFSIKANSCTLRNIFPSMNSGEPSPLSMEFLIQVANSLELTLSPINGSIAYINGIEVVSVPDNQFPVVVTPIPLGPKVDIATNFGFETSYRVNMGGPILTPENDTLWRTWVSDTPFLVNMAAARSISTSSNSIKYPDGVSAEIAPNWVYATAQEMGDANVGDQKFNVSWVFDVDKEFSYLIRLHFCDIESKALNTLVFNVYINNQSALRTFDISSKTMELSAAYYVDFAVNASEVTGKIMVQIGPTDLTNIPRNAILNGLEILKLCSSSGSFDSSDITSSTSSKIPKKSKSVSILTIGACVGGAGVLCLMVAVYCMRRLRCRKPKSSKVWLPLPAHGGNSEAKISTGSCASPAPTGAGRALAFSDITEATKNFDENLVIGLGGFGKVYKGVLDNGVVVAVKRGNPKSQQGLNEFRTEILMLSKLRHRHLVSLIGYCEELNEMILVYEYMAGGPLRKHLYGSNLPPLTWKQRLWICIGAAKGLYYLHTGASETIIHRDVKTTNILLDENLTAKVADFGLSKLGPTLDQTHVSTAVKGSFGYLDPEYFRRQQLTHKSDVYSFGVLLLEVLCARPAINPALSREQVNIAEWAMKWQKRGRIEQVMDPRLVGRVNLDSLRKFGETAEKCLAEQGSDRPTMGEVLWNLEYALQLHEASTESEEDDNSSNYIPAPQNWMQQLESMDENSSKFIDGEHDSSITTSSVLFSQIVDPKGR